MRSIYKILFCTIYVWKSRCIWAWTLKVPKFKVEMGKMGKKLFKSLLKPIVEIQLCLCCNLMLKYGDYNFYESRLHCGMVVNLLSKIKQWINRLIFVVRSNNEDTIVFVLVNQFNTNICTRCYRVLVLRTKI